MVAGHYELDLVLPHHRAAAQRLIDAAAAEGEQPTWRNLVWEALQVPSSAGPPDAWGGTIPSRYTQTPPDASSVTLGIVTARAICLRPAACQVSCVGCLCMLQNLTAT